MKKKVMTLLAALTMTAASYAQFQEGKPYAAASLSGLNLNYATGEKWNLDLGAKVGYFALDNIMVTGQLEYRYQDDGPNSFSIGPGIRYYIEQNGIYLGAGANFVHRSSSYNDFMPGIQLGYAYFLNRILTIEPEIYYNQSLKNHDQYSGFGFRVGIGIYLE